MNYYIETYQDGKQLLGSDFTTIVKNAGKIKLQNAIKRHDQRLKSLSSLKTSLLKGYEIRVVSQSWLQYLAK